MNLNDYQTRALITDSFSRSDENPVSPTEMAFVAKVLGLVGESGEFAEKIKKIIRNNDGAMGEAERSELVKELGDVLWYVATLAKYLGEDLQSVAEINLNKLADRQNRGVIKSKGDNR